MLRTKAFISSVSAIASAAARTFASVTSQPNPFQLFHPMGGVNAIVSPETSFRERSVFPEAFLACNFNW